MAAAEALTSSRARPLAVLCAITFVVRLAMFLCPGPDLSESGRVMAEEIARGNTALEILRGPLLPLHDYQQPFWGGHIVIALLAAPIFALLGPTLFALRLATLPFAMIGTCSAFLILDRLVGRRAAWIGGLLLALPPPGYLLVSCTAQGTHLEAVALALLLVVLWLRERELATHGRMISLGFTAGFALWFGFLALIPIALIVVVDLLEDRAFLMRRKFWTRFAGFVVGLAPWIHLNVIERGRGLGVYDKSAGAWFDPSGMFARATAKLAALAREDLALSLWFPMSRASAVGGLAILVTVVLVGGWSIAAGRAWPHFVNALRAVRTPHVLSGGERWALVLSLAPLYSTLYLVSEFELGPRDWLQNLRYLMPLWPLIFLGFAGELARLRARPRVIAVMSLLTVFLVCDLRRAESSAFGRDLHVPATSTRNLARMVAWSQKRDPETLSAAVERLKRWPAVERDEFLFTLGKWFRYWTAATTKLGQADAPLRPELDRTRELLRSHVTAREAAYFEAAAPDERVDLSEEASTFWARHPH